MVHVGVGHSFVRILVLVVALRSTAAAQIAEGGIARDAHTRAPLECLHVALTDSSGAQVAHTVTDHLGQFVLEAPRPGKYAVRFQTYGWEPLVGPVDTLHEGDAPQRAYPISFTNMLLPAAKDSQSFKSLPIDRRQDTLEMRRLMDPARRIGEWRRSLEANGIWQSRHIHPASLKIRYPERLFAEGREGAAIVRFIVDSTGKARPDSWTVVQTSRPEFAAALKNMLDGAWTPSTNAGQPVCDLVQHYVQFEIDARDPNRRVAHIVIMNE